MIEENEVLEKLEMAQSLNMKVQLETEQIEVLCNFIEKQEKEIKREKQYADFYKELYNKILKTIEDLEKHKIISSDEFTIKVLRHLIGE